MSNYSFDIHRVLDVTVRPAVTYSEEGGIVRATRTIVITTDQGDLEVNLYSPRVQDQGDTVLLEVKA